MVFKFILAAGAMFALPLCSQAQAAQCGQSGCSPVSSCQISSCQTCQLECDPCGGYGSEFGGVGIDVDSLTPASQSKMLYEAMQARLMFELPEDATIYLLDQQMSTPGPKRTFTVPVNDQEKIYKYQIRVEVIRGGKRYYKKVKLDTLRAGAILAVVVDAPPVADGEPAQINVEVAPVAVGGPPADDKSVKKADQPTSDEGNQSGAPPAASKPDADLPAPPEAGDQ